MSSKLTRHLKLVHKGEAKVSAAMLLPKRARNNEFQKLKRLGIKMHIEEESRKPNPDYHGEKKKNKNTKICRCSNCDMFVSKRYFHKHQSKCRKTFDAEPSGVSIEVDNVPDQFIDFFSSSGEFKTAILETLRKDKIQKLILEEEYILFLGQKYFEERNHKEAKKNNVRKSTRTEMRNLAILYQAFRTQDVQSNKHGNVLDMFDRENFFTLRNTVKDLNTCKESGRTKPGAIHSTFYTLLRSSKALRDLLHLRKEDEISAEVAQFVKSLKTHEELFMSGARHKLFMNSQRRSRKPCSLPLEEDIAALYDYIRKRMDVVSSVWTFKDKSVYIENRNLAQTRLTLFNARRGGEVSTLSLEDWEDGKMGSWIDQQRLQGLSEADKVLVSTMKTIYIPGKGNRHLVPLLIPDDCIDSMNIICDRKIR